MREFEGRRARRPWPLIGLSLALALALHTGPAAAASHGRAKAGGWQYFLRRDSAPLLRGWKHPGLPAGWTVRNGVLSKDGLVDDLESTRRYQNFELELQWKVGKESNSGIFYRATHQYDEIYWTGPEYQLVDDANTEDGKSRITAAGSVYAMYPSPAGVIHPYGHWNSARIVVRGHHVEYWANGRKIVDYQLGSPGWKKRVAASKFKAYPGYGLAPEGLIGIQGNHPGSVAIRDMRIKVLP
jgi:3-keto-disaccharide hydrolase